MSEQREIEEIFEEPCVCSPTVCFTDCLLCSALDGEEHCFYCPCDDCENYT